MFRGESGVVSRQISRLFGSGTVSGLGEGALLDRFLARRDEAAFEAILARHGPMVLAVCRKWLDDPNDVDDAFQATFLVLVRRASSLKNRELLGNWLFGVAQKVARRARIDAARRRDRERAAGPKEATTSMTADHPEDMRPLFEEIARLPESYRSPVLLCDLQGLTHSEAADRLGWPIGTVKGRLSRARDQLRNRLTRRGITVPAVALSAALAREGLAAVPETLTAKTLHAALAVAAGRSIAAGVASATAASLAEGVVTTMFQTKLKIVAAGLVASATLAAGAGAIALQVPSNGGVPPETAARRPETTETKAGVSSVTTRAPRLELASLQAEREKAANERLELQREHYETGQITIDRYLDASRNLLAVKLDAATSPADRLRALEDHLKRSEKVLRDQDDPKTVGPRSDPNIAEAKTAVLDARYLLAREKAGLSGQGSPTTRPADDPFEAARKLEDPPDDQAEEEKNRLIRAQLEKVVSMPFGSPTPLDDFVKYIKQATNTPEFPDGLPVYVDRNAQETIDTKEDKIQLSIEGITLKRTLKLALDQLDLAFTVEHGLLIIDDAESPRMPWIKERMKAMRQAGMSRPGGGGMMMSPLNSGLGAERRPQANPGDSNLSTPAREGPVQGVQPPPRPAAESPRAREIARERLALGREMLAMKQRLFQNGAISASGLQDAARTVAEFEFDAASNDTERVAALRSQLEIARKTEAIALQRSQNGSLTPEERIRAQIDRLDVELRLARMGVSPQAGTSTPDTAPPVNLTAPPPAPR